MRDQYYYFRDFSRRERKNGGACIGVDFGGVIIDEKKSVRRIDKEENSIHGGEIYMEGAIEGIKRLVEITDGRVWIISKANSLRRKRTLDWLDKVNFYGLTGFNKNNVIFCDKREEKVQICRELNINYFVDNKLHVIQLLQERIPYLFLFGEREIRTYESFASLVTPVINWTMCIDSITDSIKEMRTRVAKIKQ